mmetsp:Transcript_6130/g.13431  ORF Transcript_6130/g.13431 Transcript_6130/m.13431 type:complete len:305 (+) Transcript_6130:358-1272(+)
MFVTKSSLLRIRSTSFMGANPERRPMPFAKATLLNLIRTSGMPASSHRILNAVLLAVPPALGIGRTIGMFANRLLRTVFPTDAPLPGGGGASVHLAERFLRSVSLTHALPLSVVGTSLVGALDDSGAVSSAEALVFGMVGAPGHGTFFGNARFLWRGYLRSVPLTHAHSLGVAGASLVAAFVYPCAVSSAKASIFHLVHAFGEGAYFWITIFLCRRGIIGGDIIVGSSAVRLFSVFILLWLPFLGSLNCALVVIAALIVVAFIIDRAAIISIYFRENIFLCFVSRFYINSFSINTSFIRDSIDV